MAGQGALGRGVSGDQQSEGFHLPLSAEPPPFPAFLFQSTGLGPRSVPFAFLSNWLDQEVSPKSLRGAEQKERLSLVPQGTGNLAYSGSEELLESFNSGLRSRVETFLDSSNSLL